MRIHPQAAVSFEEAQNTIFGRREEVEADRGWRVEQPSDTFSQCTNNGALVLFSRDKMVRFDMSTGRKVWEKDVPEAPTNVFPARDMTVVTYMDGRIEGIGNDGARAWNFKLPNTGHNLTYGSPDFTVLSVESWENKKHYHVALKPSTGEVLWRQPGAVFDNPIPAGDGLVLLKAKTLMLMDPVSGLVSDQLQYNDYTRSLVGNQKGEAWFLDGQEVRKVQVKDGKIEPKWSIPVQPELCHLMTPPDGSVLYVSAKDEIRGLDPETGKELWKQPVDGSHYEWGMHVTEEGDLLVPERERLVCIGKDGSRRFDVHRGDSYGSTLRVTPRGIMALVEQKGKPAYRLERLDPRSGEVMYWAEVPRGTSVPWLDFSGTVKVTQKDSIEMFQLPDPEELPPPRSQVVAERGDSVVIGGVRVKKKS